MDPCNGASVKKRSFKKQLYIDISGTAFWWAVIMGMWYFIPEERTPSQYRNIAPFSMIAFPIIIAIQIYFACRKK